MSNVSIMGTGGVPNLRIVEDYATAPNPEFWFEVHAQIQITPQAATQIRTALAQLDLGTAVTIVLAAGVIDQRIDPVKLETLLRALYFV